MTAAVALPPVAGQHRNRALATARRVEAVRLRTQGLSYEQIARRLGYANRGTVHRIISRSLQHQVNDAAGTLLQLEVARLDALQDALWGDAMTGDVNACIAVERIITQRVRLLGLEAVAHGPGVPCTVVVPAKESSD